ncbi:LOW QUALITY PROTEIN: hypothetical protein ACHAW6_002407 [Cyclotella cf. meneghiniana]
MLWIGTQLGFLIVFFTQNEGTRIKLSKLLTIVIFAQPFNSFVFVADGVLQGAKEFPYQAKSMALSVISACLCHFGIHGNWMGIESGRRGRYAGSCLVLINSVAISETSH